MAEWVFDPRRRHVLPVDDNAARMSLPGAEPPQPVTPPPGEATVTRLAPRLSAAAGGAVSAESGQDSQARIERPGPSPAGRARHRRGFAQPGFGAAARTCAVGIHAVRGSAGACAAAPSASAGPGNDVSRPPAEGRNPWSRSTGRKGAPAPRAAADAAREKRPAAAPPAPVAAEPPEGPDDAEGRAEPAAEQGGRQGRKAARGKRASVPSWDEIMFGSSRQQD